MVKWLARALDLDSGWRLPSAPQAHPRRMGSKAVARRGAHDDAACTQKSPPPRGEKSKCGSAKFSGFHVLASRRQTTKELIHSHTKVPPSPTPGRRTPPVGVISKFM